jgi:hypothetical protein
MPIVGRTWLVLRWLTAEYAVEFGSGINAVGKVVNGVVSTQLRDTAGGRTVTYGELEVKTLHLGMVTTWEAWSGVRRGRRGRAGWLQWGTDRAGRPVPLVHRIFTSIAIGSPAGVL